MSTAPDAETLASAFERTEAGTIGLEEELMLVDPQSGDLAPVAASVLAELDGDPRFKLELPAAQLEIMTAPHRTVTAAIEELATARAALAEATAGRLRPVAAGAHPFAAIEGELNRGERYERIAAEYGRIARRQLVCALQVHVAPGGPDRALAVYNALRSYLPEIAALAANAPFHEGRDTGLASVRPKLAEQLPRQGVPPPLASWHEYAAALRWGATAGSLPSPGSWWWELRPHPVFGTLELRVPDAQTTVPEAAAVAAFAQCLVAWLGARFDAGDELSTAATWRIEENRWRAARDGVEGELADLESGRRRPTRERLGSLIAELEPTARMMGCVDELSGAGELAERNGAIRQRAVVRDGGLEALVPWLAERWLDGVPRRRSADPRG